MRTLGGVLEEEGDLHVDLVAYYVAVLDHDVHILHPATLHTPQGLGGSGYGLVDGVLEALLRDGADLRYPCYAHGRISPFPNARYSPTLLATTSEGRLNLPRCSSSARLGKEGPRVPRAGSE